MRADRLLSILMLLQARGTVSADALAEELEVSVRTIYRDIEALSTAGVPVYAEPGPGGGYALVEGYRTSLTGLTRPEMKALFMLSVPESLDKLGVSGEIRAALRKLAAAMPSGGAEGGEKERQTVYLDWQDWRPEEKAEPYLQIIHQAIREDKRLRITYVAPVAGGEIGEFERLVEPYGLVAKSGQWHLVCNDSGHRRVYLVSDIVAASPDEEGFSRPDDFNLTAFWKQWCDEQRKNRQTYTVKVRISPDLIKLMPLHLGENTRQDIQQAGPPDEKGWVAATVHYDSFWEARKNILSLGRAIEVIEPEPLRLSVVDFARQTADFYEGKG